MSPDLRDAVVHAQALQEGEHAVTFDLTKSFLQCPLHPDVRPYFTYRSQGKWYRLTSLPMGVNFAPSLMHTITSTIANVDIPGVKMETFIDNVRFHGPMGSVVAAGDTFRRRAAAVGAQLNSDTQNLPHTSGTFLRCESDYSTAKVLGQRH